MSARFCSVWLVKSLIPFGKALSDHISFIIEGICPSFRSNLMSLALSVCPLFEGEMIGTLEASPLIVCAVHATILKWTWNPGHLWLSLERPCNQTISLWYIHDGSEAFIFMYTGTRDTPCLLFYRWPLTGSWNLSTLEMDQWSPSLWNPKISLAWKGDVTSPRPFGSLAVLTDGLWQDQLY